VVLVAAGELLQIGGCALLVFPAANRGREWRAATGGCGGEEGKTKSVYSLPRGSGDGNDDGDSDGNCCLVQLRALSMIARIEIAIDGALSRLSISLLPSIASRFECPRQSDACQSNASQLPIVRATKLQSPSALR